MSGSALSEAGLLADYMILKTGMTALGKVYYRTQQDVMLHVSALFVRMMHFGCCTIEYSVFVEDQWLENGDMNSVTKMVKLHEGGGSSNFSCL